MSAANEAIKKAKKGGKWENNDPVSAERYRERLAYIRELESTIQKLTEELERVKREYSDQTHKWYAANMDVQKERDALRELYQAEVRYGEETRQKLRELKERIPQPPTEEE
jgi:hypothetical protein